LDKRGVVIMNRRGLFAAFALSPFIAVNAIAKEKPEGEPHSSQTSLMLSGTKKTSKPATVSGSGKFLTMGGWIDNDPDKQVSMAVGEDGNLWLRSKGGEWKRVVTE
jgi:hypothetical protein